MLRRAGWRESLHEQLIQCVRRAFVQAVLGALVQDQLFRLLRPVVHLHPHDGEPGVGFAVHHQQQTQGQLPARVAPEVCGAKATTPAIRGNAPAS